MGWVLLFWLACAIIASGIGNKKGMAGIGCMLGFLLGPFGILMVIFDDGDRLPCRFCQEKVHKAALVCPHCQRDHPHGEPAGAG